MRIRTCGRAMAKCYRGRVPLAISRVRASGRCATLLSSGAWLASVAPLVAMRSEKDKLPPLVYGSMTEAYDALSEPQFAHGTELLRLLEVQNGDRVLDVGCGTGRLAIATLERVGSQGRVVGIDPAKGRIDFARKHVGSRLDFHVGKA